MPTADPARSERVLYGFWISPYMAQVAQILEEAELPYRYERVSPYQGSTHTPEHRARNPLGKIPSLRDADGIDVAESQAICRYLARTYPEARPFYPIEDPARCAQVDAKNDFITFSIGGPFFNWFVFSAYMPKAWLLAIDQEAHTFGLCSLFLVKGGLRRLVDGSAMAPFLLGDRPFLPDFQLFHTLELSRIFADWFEMPMMNLLRDDPALERFHAAMVERPSTQAVLAARAGELEMTKQELFEEFGEAYRKLVDRGILERMFGHPV